MKFEVGKKYKKDVDYKHKNKPVLWVCVAIYKDTPIFCLEEPELSDTYPFTSVGNLGWVEYKEPKVHKVWIHWWKYYRGDVIPEMYRKNPLPVGRKIGDATLVHVQEVEYKET